MKLLYSSVAYATIATLAACASSPTLLDQKNVALPSPTTGNLLVLISSKAPGYPNAFDAQRQAYAIGLADGFKQSMPDIQVAVVDDNSADTNQSVMSSIERQQPSHLIKFSVNSYQEHQDWRGQNVPDAAVWEMNVAALSTTNPSSANNQASEPHLQLVPMYMARAQSDICVNNKWTAKQCGTALGRLFADTLRKQNVMQLGREKPIDTLL